MRFRPTSFLFFCLTSCLVLGSGSSYGQEIEVGYQISAGQRSGFEQIFDRFTEETGIQVHGVPRLDQAYRHDFPLWVLQGKDTPDVAYWQASQRLFYYAAQGAVHPITALWAHENLDKNFSHVKREVTYKGEVYALPVHYYNWGIYYKKSIVERFGGVPSNWEEFITLCGKIKEAGITPIGLGNRDHWPIAGWFDYIDLRLNGLDFHLKLLSGAIPFTDSRVQHVLLEWKLLIDLNFFDPDSNKMDWEDVFPYMYRDQIAITLAGNFVSSKIANTMTETIGFMPFPKMANVDDYEDAPVNVVLIPAKAKHIAEAEKFIQFMARADVQSELAANLGYLPANKSGTVGQAPFVRAGFDLLRNAAGLSQYFDRDTKPAFEHEALPVFAEFIRTGDIDTATKKLEHARKLYLN